MPDSTLPPDLVGLPEAAPVPRDRPGRRSRRGWAATLWSRIAATDPGLLRLQLAMRGTLSVALAATVLSGLAGFLGRPVTEFAFGVVFGMVGPFVMRDPTSRARQTTLLLLLLPAAVAVCASALLHAHPPAGEVWFLLAVFVGALMSARHPRALGLGLIAVVMTYVGLYLRLPPATLPAQLGSLAVGAGCIWVMCFIVLPLRPVATLQRAVRSVQRRAGHILSEMRAAGNTGQLRRHLVRLNEAALAAEDQLILLDEPSRQDVRRHLFALEQAVARLIALLAAGGVAEQHRDRLGVLAERLHRGRSRPLVGQESDPVRQTLGALTRASAALTAAADRASAASVQPVAAAPATPGPLAWPAATQVTLASLVAMLGGMALSPQRWFWAVITVYVVFINARTRGDALYKGSQRIAGTLVGLFGGLLVAVSISGNRIAECGVMLLAVFGVYYFYAVSYSVAIFAVTVLLGMIYGMLGTPLEQLLVLRLEETAIGVLAAGLAACFVWPRPTHHQVRLSGLQVLRSLREVVAVSLAAMEGGGTHAPIEAVRRLDRHIGDLRAALLPLSAGRFIMRRARVDRPLTALLSCADAAAALAAAAQPTADAHLAVLRDQAARVDARIAALLADGALGRTAATFDGPAGDVLADDGPAGLALLRLDLALAMLSARLADNLVDGFALD